VFRYFGITGYCILEKTIALCKALLVIPLSKAVDELLEKVG
jgi:hypothetical protein